MNLFNVLYAINKVVQWESDSIFFTILLPVRLLMSFIWSIVALFFPNKYSSCFF